MLTITIKDEEITLGVNCPDREIEQITRYYSDLDKFECKRFPHIKTIEDLSHLINGKWNYGEIFLHLIEQKYSIWETTQLMDNKYLGLYESTESLVVDLLDVPENIYYLIDETKCMKELKKLYLIFYQEDYIYIFTK